MPCGAGKLVGVEHVQGTAEVVGDVVGDVDQRRDRPKADGDQPVLQPFRARAILHVAEIAADHQRAGMRLSGMQRLGTPEQIAQAEADLASAYLERYIHNAIDKDVDAPTRRRLAKMLIAGGAK